MPKSNYNQLLKKFDRRYFSDEVVDIDFDGAAQRLATYLYDQDFDIDKESWNELNKVVDHFGLDVGIRVLFNLFHRHHDT